MDAAADIRDMSGKAIAKSGFPLEPVEFTCKDASTGVGYAFGAHLTQLEKFTVNCKNRPAGANCCNVHGGPSSWGFQKQ